MKKIAFILALATFSMSYAQENKNEKKETVVTKTTVQNSKGEEVSTKAVTKTEEQVIALERSDANMTNQNITMLPTKVDTNVTYSNDGVDYSFEAQNKGFKMMSRDDVNNSEDFAILRPSSQKGYYIMSQDGVSSFGYFNQNGNFVVESYDETSDSIVTTVYELQVKDKKVMKKSKM